MKVIIQTFKKDGIRVNERLVKNIADESYISETSSDIEDFLNQQYFELSEEDDE
jgi:hypothetical protein